MSWANVYKQLKIVCFKFDAFTFVGIEMAFTSIEKCFVR